MPDEEFAGPVAIPVTGELDLHTFRPEEVPQLLNDYFAECRRRGITRVRVVHGKGTGALRCQVHARLHQLPSVAGFQQGNETSGGWGATIVTLLPLGPT
jgi:DNA-nicking Smr family endonuclease